MNIIIVCYPTYGGSGVLATELGHKLAEFGHKIHFVAYKKPVRLKLIDNKVLFHKVNVPFYPYLTFNHMSLHFQVRLLKFLKTIKLT